MIVLPIINPWPYSYAFAWAYCSTHDKHMHEWFFYNLMIFQLYPLYIKMEIYTFLVNCSSYLSSFFAGKLNFNNVRPTWFQTQLWLAILKCLNCLPLLQLKDHYEDYIKKDHLSVTKFASRESNKFIMCGAMLTGIYSYTVKGLL